MPLIATTLPSSKAGGIATPAASMVRLCDSPVIRKVRFTESKEPPAKDKKEVYGFIENFRAKIPAL
jgi:hypothetical protein